MRILINGHNVPIKNIDTGRIRDVAELQQQTGWKLPEVRETIAKNETYSAAVVTFLSLRAAGVAITWDDVLDLSYNDFKVIAEPGDFRGTEAAAPDPQSPSGASAPDDEPQDEGQTPQG